MEKASSTDFLTGVPIDVDPEMIDRELSRLWKPVEAAPDASAAATRACVSNVVFFLPDAAARERARTLIPAVGRLFPSRMILLSLGEGEPGPQLRASITAVCHRAAPGSPPVCCEQIALEARDGSLDVFPGAVVPLLVPDVPVNMVILGEGGVDVVDVLEDVIDRVVLDSRLLPLQGLERACAVLEREAPLAVDDLAWRETVGWRRVICEIFDDPAARAVLASLTHVRVEHQPGSPVRAALVAGWLTSRLGRELSVNLITAAASTGDVGQILSVHLGAAGGGTFLTVRQVPGSSLLSIEYHTETACVIPKKIPVRSETEAELLGGALERTTHQGVLRGALRAACGMAEAL